MKKIYTFVIALMLIISTSTVFAEMEPYQGNSSSSSRYCFSLTRGLKLGLFGKDVLALQQFLNSDADTRVSVSGAGSPGYETEYFGPATMRAVSRFQEKYRDEILTPLGLSRGTGSFSNWSWKKLAKIHNCDSSNQDTKTVTINSISPNVVMFGDKVTVYGSNFTSANKVYITFTNSDYISQPLIGVINSTNGKTITFNVPRNAADNTNQAIYQGTYQLFVVNEKGTSNRLSFQITDAQSANKPVISYLSPSSGVVGSTVTIYGSNLSSVYGVAFAGGRIDRTQLTAISDGSIQFKVPEYVGPTPLNCFSPVADCVLPMIAKVISPGTYDVQVVTGYGNSNVQKFTVTSTTESNLTVLLPKTGDIWNRNSNYTIQWQTPNVTYIQAPRFNIYLIPETPACTTSYPQCLMPALQPYKIAENVIGSGGISSFSWNVGSGSDSRTIPDGRYQIQVCDQGGSNCDLSGTFTIRTVNVNKPPVISGVDAPTVLKIGQSATWTIRATDPENNNLTYTVRWGDEGYVANNGTMASVPPASNYVQNTSFTHTYNWTGVFQPTFYVMDSAGSVASVSASVQITY